MTSQRDDDHKLNLLHLPKTNEMEEEKTVQRNRCNGASTRNDQKPTKIPQLPSRTQWALVTLYAYIVRNSV